MQSMREDMKKASAEGVKALQAQRDMSCATPVRG